MQRPGSGQALIAGQCARALLVSAHRKHLVLHALNSQALELAVPPQLCCVVPLHILTPSGRRRFRDVHRHKAIIDISNSLRRSCVLQVCACYRCLRAVASRLGLHTRTRIVSPSICKQHQHHHCLLLITSPAPYKHANSVHAIQIKAWRPSKAPRSRCFRMVEYSKRDYRATIGTELRRQSHRPPC